VKNNIYLNIHYFKACVIAVINNFSIKRIFITNFQQADCYDTNYVMSYNVCNIETSFASYREKFPEGSVCFPLLSNKCDYILLSSELSNLVMREIGLKTKFTSNLL